MKLKPKIVILQEKCYLLQIIPTMMPEFMFDFLDLSGGFAMMKFRPGKAEEFSTWHFFRFGVIGVPLVSLLLTLNIFHTLF